MNEQKLTPEKEKAAELQTEDKAENKANEEAKDKEGNKSDDGTKDKAQNITNEETKDKTQNKPNEVSKDNINSSLGAKFFEENKSDTIPLTDDEKFAYPYTSNYPSLTNKVVYNSQTINNYINSQISTNEIFIDIVTVREKLRLHTIYVQPQIYKNAQSLRNEQRILILWGESNIGKATAALHLLLDKYFSIKRIDPSVKIDQLRSFSFDKETGYLIDTLASENANLLSSFDFNSLSQRLIEQNSHLIITVDRCVDLSRSSVQGYYIRWDERPNCTKMLKQHLTWLLFDELENNQKEIEQIVTNPAVQDLLTSHTPPALVVTLASLLVQVINKQKPLEQAITDFFSALIGEIRDRFQRSDHTIADRSLIITLAAYSGAQQHIINEADQRLKNLLKHPISITNQGSSNPPNFFTSTLNQFDAVYAQQRRAFQNIRFGPTETTIVELDYPILQRGILELVWEEFGRLRQPILTWLKGQGRASDFEVRGPAAAAAGYIARFDITMVIKKLIIPWAANDREETRNSASIALGVLADDDRYNAHVLALLQDWENPNHELPFRLAAIATYGGLISEQDPNYSLKRLYMLTQVDSTDFRLLTEIVESVLSIFERQKEKEENASDVFKTLIGWTNELGYRIAIWTGLISFLYIADVSQIEPLPPEGTWPTLLWLIKENEKCHNHITTLFQRALQNHSTRRYALNTVLQSWLRNVDSNHRLYDPFAQLIRSLAKTGDENDLDRIAIWLENRANDPKENPHVANRLLLEIHQ